MRISIAVVCMASVALAAYGAVQHYSARTGDALRADAVALTMNKPYCLQAPRRMEGARFDRVQYRPVRAVEDTRGLRVFTKAEFVSGCQT